MLLLVSPTVLGLNTVPVMMGSRIAWSTVQHRFRQNALNQPGGSGTRTLRMSMNSPPTQSFKIQPRLLLTLASMGFFLGPALDSLHNQGLLKYGSGAFQIGAAASSLFVPPLLASFYGLAGFLVPWLDRAAADRGLQKQPQPQSLSIALLSFGWAAATIKLSSLLYLGIPGVWSQQTPAANLAVLLGSCALQWIFTDRTPVGLALPLLCGAFGPLSEVPLMSPPINLWTYVAPDWFPFGAGTPGLVSFTCACYFSLTLSLVAASRFLAARSLPRYISLSLDRSDLLALLASQGEALQSNGLALALEKPRDEYHVTLWHKASHPIPPPWATLNRVGEPCELSVENDAFLYMDEKCVAISVSLGQQKDLSCAEAPHITLWVAAGTPNVYAGGACEKAGQVLTGVAESLAWVSHPHVFVELQGSYLCYYLVITNRVPPKL